jgi:hypothetical protein
VIALVSQPSSDTACYITPRAVLQMENGKHLVRLQVTVQGQVHSVLLPIARARPAAKAAEFIAERVGYLPPTDHAALAALPDTITRLPRHVGTSRLGWTTERDAFVYGTTVVYTDNPPPREYFFYAPGGTLAQPAARALAPRGDRQRQLLAFHELWERSDDFRIVLALAAASPFLETIGAPSIPVHLAGRTGLGKTTMLRLAISAYADPDSPVACVDFSKDTANYADSQLGMLHNFPILLDETTLKNAHDMAEAAYSIATGRTKGRLMGAESGYLPADTQAYRLVAFLSGEASIRDEIDKRGGAARLVEILVDQPLLPKHELPKWWAIASDHYGWFGRELVEKVMAREFAAGRRGARLLRFYRRCRRIIARRQPCAEHSRLIDALACIAVGYCLAVWVLDDGGRKDIRALIAEADDFALGVFDRLHKTTKADRVLDAIHALPNVDDWIARGFIPMDLLEPLEHEFGFAKRGEFGRFLRDQDIADKVQPRRREGNSTRAYILSATARAWFAERSPTTE